jgi:hypothetical protein
MENPLQIIQTFNIIECVSMKINDGQQTLSLIVAVLLCIPKP